VCIPYSRIPDGKKTGGRGKRDKLLTLVAQGTPNCCGPSEVEFIVALHLRDACLYESLWPLAHSCTRAAA
jgi:hypothetical protein